jgi:TolB-like protein
MALVFYKSPEEPAQCAVEISRALKGNARLQVRMGIHSGPVSGVVDVNERTNVAGVGINMAQRVMVCGDGGHILVSKHTAEDLEAYGHWRPLLHDLGTCEVKHGVRVSITNLCSDEVGNPRLPSKLQAINQAIKKHRAHMRWAAVAVAALVLAAIVGGTVFFLRRPMRSMSGVVDKSIAVLPFENLSSDKENAYFTDGVQDEILIHLAKVADLKVISRTSVMQYKTGVARNLREIGQQLGVAHVLEGSVQRAGNKVRVNAQLIDARDDRHEWAENYDRPIDDVFAIQSEIAKAIADQLSATLSSQEKAAITTRATQNTQAYDLYLRAKQLVNTASAYDEPTGIYPDAVRLLESAVARDPNFALAYCLLAQTNIDWYWATGESAQERLDRAQAALEAARRLAPEGGETFLTEGLFFYYGKRDYDHALESFEKAASLLPNNVDACRFSAYVERRLGRWTESMRHEIKASELDPRSWVARDGLITDYCLIRNYAVAERLAERAITDFPEKADYFRLRSAEVAMRMGDVKRARMVVTGLSSRDPIALQWFFLPFYEHRYDEAARILRVWGERYQDAIFPRSFLDGMIARVAGQPDKARAALLAAQQHFIALLRERKDQPNVVSQLAVVDAALGRKEEAVQEARRAVELLPISRDALTGPEMVEGLALVYSWTGERDLAIENLASLAKIPCDLSYGELKLDPVWDELRGDPRFDQIVASLAPKETASAK